MIRGVVNARLEAVVRLQVRGPGHPGLDVDAVIDSGFNSSLTLPASTVVALGLSRQSGGDATLADGSVRQFETFPAEISWDGRWRPVLVYVLGAETLLGMGLLARHELRISVVPGGDVTIASLP